jgi:hypothetical protein
MSASTTYTLRVLHLSDLHERVVSWIGRSHGTLGVRNGRGDRCARGEGRPIYSSARRLCTTAFSPEDEMIGVRLATPQPPHDSALQVRPCSIRPSQFPTISQQPEDFRHFVRFGDAYAK